MVVASQQSPRDSGESIFAARHLDVSRKALFKFLTRERSQKFEVMTF